MKDQTVSLRLLGSVFEWLEQARGQMDRSAYIVRLLQEQIDAAAQRTGMRESLLAEGRTQYTAEVCRQTLQINDEFPIHED